MSYAGFAFPKQQTETLITDSLKLLNQSCRQGILELSKSRALDSLRNRSDDYILVSLWIPQDQILQGVAWLIRETLTNLYYLQINSELQSSEMVGRLFLRHHFAMHGDEKKFEGLESHLNFNLRTGSISHFIYRDLFKKSPFNKRQIDHMKKILEFSKQEHIDVKKAQKKK